MKFDDSAHRVARRFAADISTKLRNTIERVVSKHGGKVKKDEAFAVLEHFAYRIEPIFGFVGGGMKSQDFRTPEAAEAFRRTNQKLIVTKLPEIGKPGQVYIMDVSGPEETIYGFTVSFRMWVGSEGYRVTSPEGSAFELLADAQARSMKRERIDVDPLVKWIRTETDLPSKFEAIKNEKKEVFVRTRENTGSCGACLRNIKLKEKSGSQHPVIVLHGYRRPGTGNTQGSCLGVEFPPYELSDAATKYALKRAESSRESREAWVRKLEAGEVTELASITGRVLKKENVDPISWQRSIEQEIQREKGDIRFLNRTIETLKQLISDWKLRPLPEAGQDLPVADRIWL